MKTFLSVVLATVILTAAHVEASDIPGGEYSYHIKLDGGFQDQRSGTWPIAPFTVSSVLVDIQDEIPGGEDFPYRDRDFAGHVMMTSGDRPSIQINGYTIHHNNYPNGSWDIEAWNTYYFSVVKKFTWAPDVPVPLNADAYISMYVDGERFISEDNEHGAAAYAKVNIPGASALTIVEASADWTNPNPQPHEMVGFSMMPETPTETRLYAHAWCYYGLQSGYEDVQIIADPYIFIDWNAKIDVDGTEYYATQLYEVQYSPGFSGEVPEVPEPSSFALGILGVMGLGWFGRRRKKV